MATNGTSLASEPRLEEEIEIFGIHTDHDQPVVPVDKPLARRRVLDSWSPEAAYSRSSGEAETADDFALAPLVDKIAFGLARGLVVAMKELENHITAETRKAGVVVERQLGTLQGSLTDLSHFVKEQQIANLAVQEQFQQLAAADQSLRETDAGQAVELETIRGEATRQYSELEALRNETRAFSSSVSERIDHAVAELKETDERQATNLAALHVDTNTSAQSTAERIDSLCRDVGVQQEDIAAVKVTLSSSCSRVDALVERLDRQADAVRLMHTTYSQRETELEHLIDGLARLRAFPKPLSTSGM